MYSCRVTNYRLLSQSSFTRTCIGITSVWRPVRDISPHQAFHSRPGRDITNEYHRKLLFRESAICSSSNSPIGGGRLSPPWATAAIFLRPSLALPSFIILFAIPLQFYMTNKTAPYAENCVIFGINLNSNLLSTTSIVNLLHLTGRSHGVVHIQSRCVAMNLIWVGINVNSNLSWVKETKQPHKKFKVHWFGGIYNPPPLLHPWLW